MIELEDVSADDDGALTATAELDGVGRVTVEYEPDEELEIDVPDDEDEDEDDEEREEGEPDVGHLCELIGHALGRLTPEVLDARAMDVVTRLTEETGGEEGDDAADVEAALAADLSLDAVSVIGDGTLALLYLAPDQYPGSSIRARLDDDLALGDVEVD
ncbi:hypothetical protein GCM10025768_12570 [Microbacterium pseudoresistens]|uniref:DUF2004 domain-containing protein n=1 Tax=Microbacterium pseudoresistens TaxID=640634 RepID=A0A7Y9EY08_9MICO|nr:hypothetical protein [Microbacterium pseudoresistens]NYD55160.1 hypothetical protein [Microbacterium pseudoresistens]